ncbi:unnamed protein product [Brassicogethes aeneus]|uniref:Reelin domain-containing protein n=1 Tax=Brassicogethes aeneus TaxID=1431903 RepID=A0A9P0B6P7_BRAAE|nr:unnamed protein product [Brassicogethes aeneus]
MSKLVFCFVILAVASGALAYSAGAPESVCDDMTPKHPVDPQKSQSPYKATVGKTAVKPGETVDIKISGPSLKGVLVQVRAANKAVGSFVIPDDDRHLKAINCHGNKASAATHKNSTDKKDLLLKWKAPSAPGKYTVYLTAAQDGGVFWVAKPGQTINVN